MPTRSELVNALRALSIDAIEQAGSGHPGAPLGMADMAESLWRGFLKHNPADPHWPDRDRFVLSNGHASMLLYALLHLTGYDLDIAEIRRFRQLGSRTPGHPERTQTPGVEVTSGPLGQGIAAAVGLALAERLLAAAFNREGFPVVDHRTWVFVGDGCLMEGVSQEACSLAGTLGLGKLTALYDDNGISIDGPVSGWFADDTPARFEACGWRVIRDVNGNSGEEVDRALRQALAVTDRPTLICCKTVIGYGSPGKAGSEASHGSPLGAEEAAAAKAALGWSHPPFSVPDDIRAAWSALDKGRAAQAAWEEMFARYQAEYPEEAAEFSRRMAGDLPASWPEIAAELQRDMARDQRALATRVWSRHALDELVPALPEMVGGSADLSGSAGVRPSGARDVTPGDFSGGYIHYGVREFGMGAIMNGLAAHGGFIPYGGTFLVFSDYARNAIRQAALMRARVVWVLTHDSIGVGEDGPTHQPVEHVPSLRLIPGVDVWRPCDGAECAAAWIAALERSDGPACLVLSRQSLPSQARAPEQISNMRRGAYILRDCEGEPEILLLATGSEVELALRVAAELAALGRGARVISMPCAEVFERQDAAYRESVLPPSVRARLALEAASPDLWRKYVGLDGRVIGMSGFGESAPAGELFARFGFTVDNAVRQALELMDAI